MKLTAFDKRSLSEDEPKRIKGKSRPFVKRTKGRYDQIKDHPRRTLAISTVYRRLQLNPELSVEKACTAPAIDPKQRPKPPTSRRRDPRFLADVASDQRARDIAAKWGVSPETVYRQRRVNRKAANARTV